MKRIYIVLILFVHVCCSSCRIAFAIAASQPVKEKVDQYKIDNYKLTLVRKQDWVGPWYYGYEVRKRFCGIYLPKTYYWCHRDSVNNCIVRFENRTLIIDKCEQKIIHP